MTTGPDPDAVRLVALWMVGFEEASAQQSGEICVAELFGDAIGRDRSQVRLGVKAHHDPRLHTDMVDLFEFPASDQSDAGDCPEAGHVRAVRGYDVR